MELPLLKRKEPDSGHDQKILAVVGYRYFKDYKLCSAKIDAWIKEHGTPSQIISGGCIGADSMAEKYANEHGIVMIVCKPNSSIKDNSRFAIRDRLIAQRCTHMLAFPSSKGKGTQLTISFAKGFKKHVTEHWI